MGRIPARERAAGVLVLGLLTGVAAAESAVVPKSVEKAANIYITRPALEAPIRFLSSDLLEGRGPATDASGDRVYHGAVDNASGCAQVLAIARALASLPERPRRSVLALFVGGEERNLLGSMYYAEHPTFPAGRIAADINIDGGNIFGRTRDVTLIGLGKSSLDEIATKVARSQGRVLKPDQFPDRGYYYRSDQFAFAKIGVPALFFDDGTDFIGRPAGWGREQIEQWELTKYHQPGDRLDGSWNFDGMIQDARLDMLSAWIVAQQDAMPSWKPGDEFAAARARALAAVAPQ